MSLTRSDLPTMTAENLGNLYLAWAETARQERTQAQDDFARLTGVEVDFGFYPVPCCPTCGWTSSDEEQEDFKVEGPGTAHDLGPHIHFTGCGHRWAITDIAVTGKQDTV